MATCGGNRDNGDVTLDTGDNPPESTVVYQVHTILDLETDIDRDGNPDVADPHVIRVGDTWYLYATQTKKDLHVWHSTDLKNWQRSGPIWQPVPDSWNARGQVWAPHVESTDEGYYLYYTANMQIGVARSDTPLGPFLEIYDHPFVGGGHGGVGDGVYGYDPGDEEWDYHASFITDFPEKAIDAFVLAATDGSLTFYFSAYNPLSIIQGVPMKDPTHLEDVTPKTLLESDPLGWEGFVAEGVWVVEHAGSFHLMYSGNGADRPEYAVGVASGEAPLGPFTKYAENPILYMNPEADFWGPGHHCVVEGAFGDLLMFYHTKVSKEPAFDRRIRYAPMEFGPEGHVTLAAPQP